MLRQSSSLACRLISSNVLKTETTGSSKLLWNAVQFSSKASTEAVNETQAMMSSALKVPQFSSAAASAMAAKKQHLGAGLGSLSLSSKAFSTFSAAKSSAAAGAIPAVTEAAAKASEAKPSMLKRFAQAAAVVAGAVAVAVASPVMADSPENWQWGFQDAATSTMQAAADLHHDIAFFLLTTVALVLYMTFQIVTKFHYSRSPIAERLTHHTTLEMIWTVIPTMIVLSIAVPSLTLIYSLDQHTDRPGLTVKIIGRQWYWSYEMHDHLQHKLVDPEKLISIAEKAIKA